MQGVIISIIQSNIQSIMTLYILCLLVHCATHRPTLWKLKSLLTLHRRVTLGPLTQLHLIRDGCHPCHSANSTIFLLQLSLLSTINSRSIQALAQPQGGSEGPGPLFGQEPVVILVQNRRVVQGGGLVGSIRSRKMHQITHLT